MAFKGAITIGQLVRLKASLFVPQQKRAMAHHPHPADPSTVVQRELSSGEQAAQCSNKESRPLEVCLRQNSTQNRYFTTQSRNHHSPALAAFTIIMSEPPHQIEFGLDYWMKTDLLDACYDPRHDGMGLDGQAEMDHTISPFHTATSENLTNGFETQSHEPISSSDLAEGRHQMAESRKSYSCRVCKKDYNYLGSLERHSRYSNHLTLECSVHGCDILFNDHLERDAHQRRPHLPGHGRAAASSPYDCIECDTSCSSKANLLRHAKESQHRPYGCDCGMLFSRLDVLHRHLESLGSEEPKFPCEYQNCKRHRGANGFHRKDHLTQHLRNYHHVDSDNTVSGRQRRQFVFPVCSFSSCPQFRDPSFNSLPLSQKEKNKPFTSQSAYTRHMKDEHQFCSFPCTMEGCDRIGRRGYFREKNLIKHRQIDHPDASTYSPAKRETKYTCTEPDCRMMLDPSSFSYHMRLHECNFGKDNIYA